MDLKFDTRLITFGGIALATAVGLYFTLRSTSTSSKKKDTKKLNLKKYAKEFEGHPLNVLWAPGEDGVGLFVAADKANEKIDLKSGSMLLKIGDERVAGIEAQKLIRKLKKVKEFPLTIQLVEQPALEEKWAKAQEHRTNGGALFKEQKFEEALAEYESAIEEHPTHKTLHSNRALCLVKLNRAKLALEACRNLFKIDPSHAKGHYYRACAYITLSEELTEENDGPTYLDEKQSHIQRAIAELRTVLKLKTTDRNAEQKLKLCQSILEEVQKEAKEKREKAQKAQFEIFQKMREQQEAIFREALEKQNQADAEDDALMGIKKEEATETTTDEKTTTEAETKETEADPVDEKSQAVPEIEEIELKTEEVVVEVEENVAETDVLAAVETKDEEEVVVVEVEEIELKTEEVVVEVEENVAETNVSAAVEIKDEEEVVVVEVQEIELKTEEVVVEVEENVAETDVSAAVETKDEEEVVVVEEETIAEVKEEEAISEVKEEEAIAEEVREEESEEKQEKSPEEVKSLNPHANVFVPGSYLVVDEKSTESPKEEVQKAEEMVKEIKKVAEEVLENDEELNEIVDVSTPHDPVENLI